MVNKMVLFVGNMRPNKTFFSEAPACFQVCYQNILTIFKRFNNFNTGQFTV